MSGLSWAHPAQRLLLWIWVACGLQWMQPTPLVFALVLMLPCAAFLDGQRLWRGLRRSVSLLLGIVFVYGWSVPGQYLWFDRWAPTWEGLQAGGVQALHLLALIVSLRLLLARLRRDALLSGIYALLLPLSRLGFDMQRATWRLMLTLCRVDELLTDRATPGALWRELTLQESDFGPPPDVEWRPSPPTGSQRWVLTLLWLGLLATLAAGMAIN